MLNTHRHLTQEERWYIYILREVEIQLEIS